MVKYIYCNLLTFDVSVKMLVHMFKVYYSCFDELSLCNGFSWARVKIGYHFTVI
jgi:hypothetical protein